MFILKMYSCILCLYSLLTSLLGDHGLCKVRKTLLEKEIMWPRKIKSLDLIEHLCS